MTAMQRSGRRFDAVIFDMDGVLVDSEPMHVEAMREVLQPFAVPYTDADNERYFGFTERARMTGRGDSWTTLRAVLPPKRW